VDTNRKPRVGPAIRSQNRSWCEISAMCLIAVFHQLVNKNINRFASILIAYTNFGQTMRKIHTHCKSVYANNSVIINNFASCLGSDKATLLFYPTKSEMIMQDELPYCRCRLTFFLQSLIGTTLNQLLNP
jgi:hypothetical protein